MCKMLGEIIKEGKKLDLQINANKMKIMRIGKTNKKKEIKVSAYVFEMVE